MQKEVVYPLALRTYPRLDSNHIDFHNCSPHCPIGIASLYPSRPLQYCGPHRVEFVTSSLSKWPLFGHVLEDCDMSTNTSNAQPSLHKGYRGVDLKLQYNMENDSHVVFCDTYTYGSFEVFVMVNSVQLSLLLPKQQFTLPKEGLPTFIRISCMTKFKQSGRGSLISYSRQMNSKYATELKMAVVNAFRYDLEGFHTIELWEFLDVVDENGVPVILNCDQWESMLPLLRPRNFYLDDIELLFLNQVGNI
jgi:hypothetical protein